MNKIIPLIDFYISTEEVMFFEESLKKLVSSTTTTNCLEIINYMENQSATSELDISMFIYSIASPKYKNLAEYITAKILVFKDKDATGDLEDALGKILKNEN